MVAPNIVGFFDNLLGGKKEEESKPLCFKSPCAAYQFEFQMRDDDTPAERLQVLGIVLESWIGRENRQVANLIVALKYPSQTDAGPSTRLPCMPDLDLSKLSPELRDIALTKGRPLVQSFCVDDVPKLNTGDLVMVTVQPSGLPLPKDSPLYLVGIIGAAVDPILNLKRGWALRTR